MYIYIYAYVCICVYMYKVKAICGPGLSAPRRRDGGVDPDPFDHATIRRGRLFHLKVVYIYIYIYIYMYMYTYIRTYIYIYIDIYIYIYIYTPTHISHVRDINVLICCSVMLSLFVCIFNNLNNCMNLYLFNSMCSTYISCCMSCII